MMDIKEHREKAECVQRGGNRTSKSLEGKPGLVYSRKPGKLNMWEYRVQVGR